MFGILNYKPADDIPGISFYKYNLVFFGIFCVQLQMHIITQTSIKVGWTERGREDCFIYTFFK